VDELLTWIIIGILVFGGAIWKFLVKVLGSAPSVKTAIDVQKKGKSLFEMIAEGDLEKFVRKLAGEEPDEDEKAAPGPPRQPPAAPARETFGAPVAPPRVAPVAAIAPTPLRPDARSQPPRRRLGKRPVAQPAARMAPPVEVREQRLGPPPESPLPVGPARQLLVGPLDLNLGDRKTLREAIIWREVFGPPKAFRLPGRGGLAGHPRRMTPP